MKCAVCSGPSRRRFCSPQCSGMAGHKRRYSDPATRVAAGFVRGGPNECWLWRGLRDKTGYGRIVIDKKKWRAHRIVYEMERGPIPIGLLLRHSCDTPACVNPGHLVPGTHADNLNDMVRRGRDNRMGRAKLDWTMVAEIRSSPESCAALARKYGVGPSAVENIRKGVTWVRP